MNRILILITAYLIFSVHLASAAAAGEKPKPLQKIISQPEPVGDELTAGTYFVIGVFRNLSNARRLRARHIKLDPAIIAAKSSRKIVFRVIIGPVQNTAVSATRKNLGKVGIDGAWPMQVHPGSRAINKRKKNLAASKSKHKIQNEPMPVSMTKTVPPSEPVPASMTETVPQSEPPTAIPETPQLLHASSSQAPEPVDPEPAAPSQTQTDLLPVSKNSFKPGNKFSDCDICPKMVVIPAGKFVMGEPDGGMTGDAPATKVSLPRAIAIGQFEVTFAEWDACVSGGGCSSYRPPDEGWGRARQPVTNINWNDAWNYAAWLAAKTGHLYRLPSEAEWEYAARAGSGTKFWWGDDPGLNRAVCQNCGSIYDGQKASPVGSFAPNPFGLFDTAGNLWEWTRDCYKVASYKDHKFYPDPVPGPNNCSHVLRGGGWDVISAGITSSFRFTSGSSNRSNIYGFRVVRELQ